MYLRFVYHKSVDGLRSREGLFQAAAEAKKNPLAPNDANARAEEIIRWFQENLPDPVRLSLSKSKGHYRKNTKGLSWFKPTARKHIEKAFQLKAILEECGYSIELLKEDRVGFIVYEDEYQLVAEPFADTRG